MRFYEQDILMLDYLYTEDVTVDFDVEYAMPGFGIVFSAYNKWDGKTRSEAKMLLAKLGSMEFSVYEKVLGQKSRMHQESNTLKPDGRVHRLRFEKRGSCLYAFEVAASAEDLLGKYNFGESYDRFYIGIYSNSGNTVKRMEVCDDRPSAWNASIENTDGGRVAFHQDGFEVDCAENAAEVIREDIPLDPGRYFFDYRKNAVDGECRVNAYVFPSTEPKIKAKEKNLLKTDAFHYGETPYFDVEEKTKVTVLFQVYSGSVSNVAIKKDPAQVFVSTNDRTDARAGSFLQLNLNNLESIKWTGVVYSVPYKEIDAQPVYSVFSYGKRSVNLDSGNVNKNVSYDYELKLSGGVWVFRIYLNGKEIHYSAYVVGETTAKIFDNVSGKIERITIVDKSGRERDVLYQRTIKKFIPSSIQSPIIVTGKDGVPFDISAAYRILPDGKYFFTNWEREIFKPDRVIDLAKPLCGSTDIVLYGIRGDYDLDHVYDIPREELVNSIDAVADQYDEITSDNYEIRKDQTLVINDTLNRAEYSAFIVDYLKNDSYSINKGENGEYELDIATEKEDANTYYDVSDSGEIRSYQLLDIDGPEDDSYIVLRRNEVSS